MPYSQKPIVAIIGSETIMTLNLSQYINPKHCGAVISGGAAIVDNIVEQWAKIRNVECLVYKPNYEMFGDRALLERNEDMVNAADIAIVFWNGSHDDVLYALQYCERIGRRYICHLIIDL